MVNSVHKAFTAYPFAVLSADNEVCDLQNELEQLKNDVIELTQIAEHYIDYNILYDLKKYGENNSLSLKSSEIGRRLKIFLPKEIKQGHAVASRFEKMFQDRVINETKTWLTRLQVTTGESKKYVSQGWERTVRDAIPCDLKPKMCLSAVDKQHSFIDLEALYEYEVIKLHTCIGGSKRIILFPFDKNRFPDIDKISLPDIMVNEFGKLQFNFTAVKKVPYYDLSTDYVVSVDVGKTHYATASVVNKNGDIVYSTTLSRRVHSLENKVRNAEVQVRSLQKQERRVEAVPHRKANSRRKRELAILAAQEIADLAYCWGNAVVVVEDLSWIENTMQNGRWNRGELIKWLKHYTKQNSSLVFSVSAHNTSKVCHKCGHYVMVKEWHNVVCVNNKCTMSGKTQDRDVNATGNIAKKLLSRMTLDKTVQTRKKSKNYVGGCSKLSTPKTKQSLKYPGRDRTKNSPTPKQRKSKHEVKVSKMFEGVNEPLCSVSHSRVATDGGAKHTTPMIVRQHKNLPAESICIYDRLC